MATFSAQHPQVLKNYKEYSKAHSGKGTEGRGKIPDGDFDEGLFAEALILSLRKFQPEIARLPIFTINQGNQ